MKFRPLDRRTLLRGVGGAALGLPLLEAMTPRRALAQEMSAPKRIVFFQTPNGMQMEGWRSSVNGGDPSDFTLSPTLTPLAAHQEKLLILDGINMDSSYDDDQHATAHQGGAASLWTGTYAGPGQMDGGGNLLSGYAISHSIEYELAQQAAITENTKFPSYYFGVLPTSDHVITRMFYAGRDQPISPNANPIDVNRQLFSDFASSEAELARRTADRRTVLNAVLGDYRSLRCKLGTADRTRLDLHMNRLEAIEAQLGRGGSEPPSGACQPPGAATGLNFNNRTFYREIARVQMDQMVMALACDLTRIAAFQWNSPVGAIIHFWLEGHDETHHDYTHRSASDTVSQDKLKQINRWYAEEFAYLLSSMDAIEEANGKTLLENSIVVWATEVSDARLHERNDMPFVIAGGGQGAIRTGRLLQYTDGPAHNRLLVALANAMGLEITEFGAAGYSNGGPLDLT